MCVRYGAVTLMRGDAGVKIAGREHCADVILSKGYTEPTTRAIIQTPCSGGHLHNFMGLHGRFSSALAPWCRARYYRDVVFRISWEDGERWEREREREIEQHEEKKEMMAKGIVEAIVKFDRVDRKRAELDALSDSLRPVFTREKWIHTVREHYPHATLLMHIRFEFQIHYLRRRRQLNRFMKIKHLYWIFFSSFFPLLFLIMSFSGKRIDLFTMIKRIMIYMDKITVVIIEPFICEELNFCYLRYIANVCILLNVIVKHHNGISQKIRSFKTLN